MTTIDQFESVFLSADKAVFTYASVTVADVLLVSDLDDAAGAALIDRCRGFLAAIDRPETRWDQLGGGDFASVKELLDAVEARHPGFYELIVDPEGVAQRFVTLFVNGDEIDRDALDTLVADGDEVEILTSAAGG